MRYSFGLQDTCLARPFRIVIISKRTAASSSECRNDDSQTARDATGSRHLQPPLFVFHATSCRRRTSVLASGVRREHSSAGVLVERHHVVPPRRGAGYA